VRRLHFLVEGQTEETVAGDLIVPHFEALGWSVSVSILTTRRVAGQSANRGGVTSWTKIVRDIRPDSDPLERVRHVESAMAAAIGHSCFLPHLVLHETEAWVLGAVEQLGAVIGDPAGAAALKKVVDESGGPEMVDDGPTTAPSKRLTGQWPAYQKTFDGPYALLELGLPGLRRQCPHLDDWLRTIEEWPGG
jgi:hypothetical protein